MKMECPELVSDMNRRKAYRSWRDADLVRWRRSYTASLDNTIFTTLQVKTEF